MVIKMTRLDRIIQAFNDYDDLVDELALRNCDNSQDKLLNELRNQVSVLIGELKKHGCRREN